MYNVPQKFENPSFRQCILDFINFKLKEINLYILYNVLKIYINFLETREVLPSNFILTMEFGI